MTKLKNIVSPPSLADVVRGAIHYDLIVDSPPVSPKNQAQPEVYKSDSESASSVSDSGSAIKHPYDNYSRRVHACFLNNINVYVYRFFNPNTVL